MHYVLTGDAKAVIWFPEGTRFELGNTTVLRDGIWYRVLCFHGMRIEVEQSLLRLCDGTRSFSVGIPQIPPSSSDETSLSDYDLRGKPLRRRRAQRRRQGEAMSPGQENALRVLEDG